MSFVLKTGEGDGGDDDVDAKSHHPTSFTSSSREQLNSRIVKSLLLYKMYKSFGRGLSDPKKLQNSDF